LSETYPGKLGDRFALDTDRLVRVALEREFDRASSVLILGDKGYANCMQLFDSRFGITKSGIRAAGPLADHFRCGPEFSQPRAVVERVIGKLKSLSDFIAGPITINSAHQLREVILIYSGIINRLLEKRPEMFSKLGETN
jgi:hypothetical protein